MNGIRIVKSPSVNGSDLNFIPLEAIDRVEILLSSGSAIYGSDALAGVINIITRKPEDEEGTLRLLSEWTADGGSDQNLVSASYSLLGEEIQSFDNFKLPNTRRFATNRTTMV